MFFFRKWNFKRKIEKHFKYSGIEYMHMVKQKALAVCLDVRRTFFWVFNFQYTFYSTHYMSLLFARQSEQLDLFECIQVRC